MRYDIYIYIYIYIYVIRRLRANDIVSFLSCIKPLYLPLLIRNVQCCQKLYTVSCPSSKVALNIPIGFQFNHPFSKWGLGRQSLNRRLVR